MLVMLTMRPCRRRAHLRQHGEDGVQRPPEVHVHRFREILPRHRLRRADRDDPGVVDQNVDLSELIRRQRQQPLDLVRVGHVTRHGQDVRPPRLQVLPCPRQFVFVPRTDRKRQPCPANSRARASPSPREPPVTRATWPVRSASVRRSHSSRATRPRPTARSKAFRCFHGVTWNLGRGSAPPARPSLPGSVPPSPGPAGEGRRCSPRGVGAYYGFSTTLMQSSSFFLKMS